MKNFFSVIQGWVKLKGNSDGSFIGNIRDSLKVDFDSTSRDSFGRLRVSDVNNIFESTHVNSEQTEFWDFSLSGGGTKTYNAQKSCVQLSVGTVSGDMAIRQTLNYFHYAAGQSMIVRMTGVLGVGKTNVQKGFGYGDSNNGLSFRTTNEVFEVVVRSDVSGSVVDNAVSQSSFNGDRLDGTGPSGLTIDLDQSQIFEINYQWLGVGNVYFYVHINGRPILLHVFQNANLNNTVYMRTPHLPVRYGIKNIGTTSSSTTIDQICTQVSNEGNSIVGDLINSVDNGDVTKSINSSTFVPIISMRTKAANDILVQLESIDSLVTTSDDIIIQVTIDAVLTGANFVSDSQFIEKDVSATELSGGRHVLTMYVSKTSKTNTGLFKDKFRLGKYIDGTKQTITVSAKTFQTSASMVASIVFKELF